MNPSAEPTGTDGGFLGTDEPGQGAGLGIGVQTRHGHGGELGATRRQLGFQALSCLGCSQLLSQTSTGAQASRLSSSTTRSAQCRLRRQMRASRPLTPAQS